MKKSNITNNMETCFICGGQKECVHHIYGGTGRRAISDREGMILPLCNTCHNMSENSVHFNKKLDNMAKRMGQIVFEKNHTRAEFVGLFGRNYLD